MASLAWPADMTPEELRAGIFNLRTRRFGTVCEHLVRVLTGSELSRTLLFDLYEEVQSLRVEVKFCTALRRAEPIADDGILSAIRAAACDRAFPFAQWRETDFDANIQQVKRALFDVLYYGIFFQDRLTIFKIDSTEIRTSEEIAVAGGVSIGYSDKQHRGNKGEGQFHISQRSLGTHLDHFHYRDLSYVQVLDLFRS